MDVLVLSCSNRPKGNTEQLADAFAEGCLEAGHTLHVLKMSGLAVGPCTGCNSCVNTGVCAFSDGMTPIYDALEACDAVVFITPIFFWTYSAQMKLVIDRIYALGRPNDKGYYAYPKKRCALIASAADTERHFWTFESLQNYWWKLTHYLQWERMGELFVGGVGGTKVPRRIAKTDALDRSRAFGKSFQ